MADVTEIMKFDPRTIKDHTVVAIIGPRGSGKSLLVRDIMYHKCDNNSCGFVMSSSEPSTAFYSKFVPDAYVHHRFDKDALERLVERQRTLWAAGERTRCFVVLDDPYDEDAMTSEIVRRIFILGRHYGIFLVVCVQSLSDIPRKLRSNVDYVFACRDPDAHSRRKLYETYFSVLPTKKVFEKVFQACTEDYEVLVMDRTIKHSNQAHDVVFWYKADKAFYDLRRFRVAP